MPTHVRMLCFLPALLASLCLPTLTFGQDRDEDPGYGRTERPPENRTPEGGMLTATGMGLISRQEPDQARAYLQAYQTAKMDALRNLLMQVDQIHIDSRSVGVDFELKDDMIRAELRGRLRGAKVVAEHIVTMGNGRLLQLTVTISPQVPERNTGSFRPAPRSDGPSEWRTTETGSRRRASAPVPQYTPHRPPVAASRAPLPAPPVETPRRAPSRPDPYRPSFGGTYTAVIIDARGYHLERSMSPRIRRADGGAIWGNVKVDPDWVNAHGIVVYAHSVQEARNNLRAGERPLVLQAVGIEGGQYPSDPVLSNADATCLLQANDTSGFLEKFRVIFVVDAEK